MNLPKKELEQEENELIQQSVENEEYFQEAIEWYSISYILPYSQRAFFTLLFILSLFVTYLFSMVIYSALPLKERLSIVVEAKDTALYTPKLVPLVNKNEAKSTEEAVLRFLIINYLKEWEEHNYKRANINSVNIKLDKIKNNSSTEVFEQFKSFMSRTNYNSPIHFFGKNVERTVDINAFAFVQTRKLTIFDKMRGFLAMYSLPTKAYVDYTINTILPDQSIEEKKRAELSFKFSGVNFDKKTKNYLPLYFTVIEYKKYDE
jgi:type IV secretory pathway component VirB8